VTVDDRKLLEIIRAVRATGNPLQIVADGVEYGVFQELGTRFMPGRHFMRSAVEAVRGWYFASEGWSGLPEDPAVADKLCRQAAFMVEAEAKKSPPCPVDTGALRASIHVVQGTAYEFEVLKPK